MQERRKSSYNNARELCERIGGNVTRAVSQPWALAHGVAIVGNILCTRVGKALLAAGHRLTQHVMGVCEVTLCPCTSGETQAAGTPGTADCQRCHMDGPAVYRVQTSEIDLMVCERCADVAAEIGLRVASLR